MSDAVEFLEVYRDFICWRSREFADFYGCVVSQTPDGYVKLVFDVGGFEVSQETASDLGLCLAEEVATSYLADGFDIYPPPPREEAVFKRGAWGGVTSNVSVRNGSHEFFSSGSGETLIRVNGIKERGFEIVFEHMCFSFSREDALWLSEKLLAVCGRAPAFPFG
ncbi:hypothetical protein HBO10_29335 [Pseudomonas sp. WS 5503]|uniref:hypothetical protein n=1 Tax=Pseudomonas sp. WS 5503 TaxID=2717497 RepID=UPI001474A892|nr:hypothetical protein [Pseudomonas sp. WS 5503]NMX83611.1 hypothetical protein [Pseudomonas sp. WS 5503]